MDDKEHKFMDDMPKDIKKGYIINQLNKLKEKTNMMTDTITNNLFDTNLLTALREDLHKLIQQNNDIIMGEVFLFQLIQKICDKENINIPNHIKKHFRI